MRFSTAVLRLRSLARDMQMMQKQTPQSAKSGFLGDRGSTTLVVGKQKGEDSFHITEPALVLQHLAYDSSIQA